MLSSFTQLVLGFWNDPAARVELPSGRSLDYRIVISNRARRMRLKIAPETGLVVVAPRGFKRRRIEDLVFRERDWIARHISRLEERPKSVRPTSLDLRAIGETWQVEYVPSDARTVRARILGPGSLALCGAVEKTAATRNAMKRWLRKRGDEVLVPWLAKLSKETGLRYSNARIKGQRTRWGSCSSGKVINLNYHLLFLSPECVRYILIHELCHTVQMNHTKKFWALVTEHSPDAKAIRKTLRSTRTLIPEWFFHA